MPTAAWFEGRTAIVTGASRGIGRAIAERLAAERADLVLSATDPARLATAAAACREHGARVVEVVADLADPEAPGRLVSAAVEAFGRLDVVISNAFWDEAEPLEGVSVEGWDRTVRVTLTAPMLLAKAALEPMRRQGSGSIVFISSMRAVAGGHGMVAYESAKAALFALTRSIAVDYGPAGIRCNCVSPGFVMSERARDWIEGAPWRPEAMAAVIPLGRPGRPEEIASIVAFVASPEASFLHGAIIWADGGALAGLPENAALALAERHMTKEDRGGE